MNTEGMNLADPDVVNLLKEAERSTPEKRERIIWFARIMSERSRWETLKSWPDLFNLYQKPEGEVVAELASSLGQRKLMLEQGIGESQSGLESTIRAFFHLRLAADHPMKPGPEYSEVPTPDIGVHGACEAASSLYLSTVLDRLVLRTLQETLAPRIKDLFEGSGDLRQSKAKQLKRDLCKTVDHFASFESPPGFAHGNKILTNENEGAVSAQLIEAARQLVEETRELPTKCAVKTRLNSMLPQILEISARTWARLFKGAGLGALPSKASWK